MNTRTKGTLAAGALIAALAVGGAGASGALEAATATATALARMLGQDSI